MCENIFEIPESITYPVMYDVKENFELFRNVYCYIIDKYDINHGYNLYIGFRDKYQFVRLSNFNGDDIHLGENNLNIISYIDELSKLMKLTKIPEMSFYFSCENNPILVDVMVSINKMIGPGMLHDLFHNIVPTQKIIKNKIIDDDILSNNNIILKPTKYKYIYDNEKFNPLYGIINEVSIQK